MENCLFSIPPFSPLSPSGLNRLKPLLSLQESISRFKSIQNS